MANADPSMMMTMILQAAHLLVTMRAEELTWWLILELKWSGSLTEIHLQIVFWKLSNKERAQQG